MPAVQSRGACLAFHVKLADTLLDSGSVLVLSRIISTTIAVASGSG